ncbi:uncharacterized protein LOC144701271 [Wolffia australiana]
MPEDDFIKISSDHEDDADEVENKDSELIEEVHSVGNKGIVDDKEEGEASEGENEELLYQVKSKEYSIHESSVEKSVESVLIIENESVTKTKRSRTPGDGHDQPSVHVVYKSLSRASRRKLEELLQEWSEWHTRNVLPSNNTTKEEVLEDGEETYLPVLFGEKSTIVSFRVDKRARSDVAGNQDTEFTPLYDRGFSLGLSSSKGLGGAERVEPGEASRCFNCGSYSHSLKECPRPRDASAIALARGEHSARKNSSSGQRSHSRYYQSSGGKFDGLKPGFLSPELRQSLGIGEFDPPPWLNRMRELGYPPGYLEEGDEDGPSGIIIFAEEEEQLEYEEGELPERGKRMAVDFPGVNAPIPEKADRRVWATSPGSPVGRRQSPPRYDDYDRRNSLSRTPSFGERERERGLVSLNGSPYPSGYNTFSDRWSGGATVEGSQAARDHRHDQYRHHHQHHHHHHGHNQHR